MAKCCYFHLICIFISFIMSQVKRINTWKELWVLYFFFFLFFVSGVHYIFRLFFFFFSSVNTVSKMQSLLSSWQFKPYLYYPYKFSSIFNFLLYFLDIALWLKSKLQQLITLIGSTSKGNTGFKIIRYLTCFITYVLLTVSSTFSQQ